MPLKQIIFFRLIKQLSEVYVSMTIEDFEKAASIVPFSIAETWMANASRQQGISIQINYMQKAIIFGAATKVDMLRPQAVRTLFSGTSGTEFAWWISPFFSSPS
ncbi:unnamed protein product [Effrenium voratum]|uniref:Uncharacterized protein n=1 Tax=Effrenium voratum TaxID=2562239 RepID=A0AA36MVZ0_9DINO|nr:unnamed protein product [Effrenium voratum]CAJ1416798.1 unnamed protein product [Effrenium voratum]